MFSAFPFGPLSYFIYQLPCYCRGSKSGPLITSPAVLRYSEFLRLLGLFFVHRAWNLQESACDPKACSISWCIFHDLLHFPRLSVTKENSSKCSWESTPVLLKQPPQRSSLASPQHGWCTPPRKLQVNKWLCWTWKQVVQIKTAFSNDYFKMTEN